MKKNATSRMGTPFVLMTFCIFAMSVFLVLILSGSAYRNMVDISSYGLNERVALSYIRTKIRQSDRAGAVEIADFGGVFALTLHESIGHEHFVTRIYFYDGWVKELFSEAHIEFSPRDGIGLVQVEALSFHAHANGMIEVIAGHHGTLRLFPRSGGARP
ncbi:MAG: DUF4860 domain-containing protein [Defluviitaleaceae bacterium]|nr:DUF4860 domain-containing protein [Defluviitaleaceae bacterium]